VGVGRELLTYKISSHQTGGACALFEAITDPGVGPPPHVHHREDESFYVLEGAYEFLSGRETLRASAGSLLYVPKCTLYAHKNVGEGEGRILLNQTPGGCTKSSSRRPVGLWTAITASCPPSRTVRTWRGGSWR